MKSASQLHDVALDLMAHPAVDGSVLGLLHGLARHADVLWSGNRNATSDAPNTGEPEVRTFRQATSRLGEIADLGAPKVGALLDVLGTAWWDVPPATLRTMAEFLAGARDTVCPELEIRHVAWWLGKNRLAGGKVSKRLTCGAWDELLSAALDFQPHDEIALRREPFNWTFPVASGIRFSGFEFAPITSSAQLVDSRHHKGLLCSLELAKTCLRGEEAWFFAWPKFWTGDNDLCLIGLLREGTEKLWTTKEIYAPRKFHDDLHAIALSVAARTNGEIRLAAIRGFSQGMWSSAGTLASWATKLRPSPGMKPEAP